MSYLSLMHYPAGQFSPLFGDLRDTIDPFLQIFTDLEHSYAVGRWEAEETKDAYVFTIPLPGFKREEVDIQLLDYHLSVRAEHKDPKRGSQHIQREITLAHDIDLAKVEAKLEDGLLTVTVGKLAPKSPRKVPVT